MADTPDRFLNAFKELDDVIDQVTPEDAAQTFDATTLQNFWRDWPHISSWAGSLWRHLNAEIESAATPVTDDDHHEVGEAG